MPNPTLTPTLTALARELAERDLSRWPSCGCCRIFSPCTHCVAKQLLSALASPPVEAAQGEWISMKERLPEDGARVLLVRESRNDVTIGNRDNDHFWHGGGRCSFKTAFTHWKPLPPPPAAPEARR